MQTWYTEEEIHAVHYGMIRAADPGTVSHIGGHLEYVRGKGIHQSQRSDCKTCQELGWNDFQWHPIT